MIIFKTNEQIDAMKPAGFLAWWLLEEVQKMITPGISTQDIDDFIAARTKEKGGISAPLHYKGFPKSVCTSVNEVVCHGIPSEKVILRNGDIINVDVTPIVNGYHGDSSRTFFVGDRVSQKTKALVACAQTCLDLGIKAVRSSGFVGDIGYAIEHYATRKGYGVVRDFVGHGIGQSFHEEPQIPHYGKRGQGPRLLPGMVFTIEPMINEGGWACQTLKDGWTAITADRKLSAQFEHTIGIRMDGTVEILTQPN